MVVIGGTTAIERNGSTYNAAPIVLPDGTTVYHDKVYLTDWEQKQKLVTGRAPTVVKTPWGKIAVLICYDSEFPDLSLDLAKQQIDVLVIPSMTESKHGETRVRWAAQARAVEHSSFVLVATTARSPSKDW